MFGQIIHELKMPHLRNSKNTLRKMWTVSVYKRCSQWSYRNDNIFFVTLVFCITTFKKKTSFFFVSLRLKCLSWRSWKNSFMCPFFNPKWFGSVRWSYFTLHAEQSKQMKMHLFYSITNKNNMQNRKEFWH